MDDVHMEVGFPDQICGGSPKSVVADYPDLANANVL
jgi:hypothetical protein